MAARGRPLAYAAKRTGQTGNLAFPGRNDFAAESLRDQADRLCSVVDAWQLERA